MLAIVFSLLTLIIGFPGEAAQGQASIQVRKQIVEAGNFESEKERYRALKDLLSQEALSPRLKADLKRLLPI